MLVECKNCGAPLDVVPGVASAMCRYCGTQSMIAQSRTIAPHTPPGWQPPRVWMPPPQFPAPHVQLSYKRASGCGLAFALLMTFGIIAFVGAILAVVFVSLRSSGAYVEALDYLKKNPEVVADLGKPIEDGLIPTGSISTSGPSGSADLDISLSGPKGEGSASITLVKSGGTWRVVSATWHHDGSSSSLPVTITKSGPLELDL